MDRETIVCAVEAWRRILGPDHVLLGDADLEAYRENTAGLSRVVSAVLRPVSTEEVLGVVEVANQFCVPLYPVSCGKNWGLGSALPVRDGCVIVDLRRMNRILEVSAEGGYAVIEPGVTQGQLYEHLRGRGIPLRLNVTGSGTASSLVGNALERGIGYFSSRADSLSGLEVVLGNGKLLRTGMSHYGGSKISHRYRHGIGPSLDGLFAQSAYGIVTRAGVELLPAHDRHMAVLAKIHDESRFELFVDALIGLRKRGVIRTVIHVGNRERTLSTLGPILHDCLEPEGSGNDGGTKRRAEAILAAAGFGAWSAVAGVSGTAGLLKLARKEIRCALRGVAHIEFLTDRRFSVAASFLGLLSFLPGMAGRKALLDAVRPLYELSKGIPTDEAVKSVYWPLEERATENPPAPDGSPCGMLYCLPFIPADGGSAKEAVELARRQFEGDGFVPYITLNVVDERSAECVVSLAFDKRRKDQVARAHACIQCLQEQYIGRGMIPYRVGIEWMGQIVDDGDVFWRTVRDLKAVLDPNNIISPGRYNLI